jgi:bacillithiol system protein YtxJ
MSLFKKIVGSSNKESTNSKIGWKPLIDLGQLNEIVDFSNEKPVAIFKHSTRCSISRMALKQFENEFNLQNKIDIYFLDLLNYREISNEIANRFNVIHQSPQILLIKNGKAIYHDSHSDIEAAILNQYL